MTKQTCLITGSAGFIGYHLTIKLLRNGINVVGIDNLNDYYDVNLKEQRLNQISNIAKELSASWIFIQTELEKKESIEKLFEDNDIDIVFHLAAQAGVRYSLVNPSAYINSNIVGFNNVIETSVKNKISNFIYASSSSVYGGNQKVPFSEKDSVDHPVSLYAATKRSNELIAHSYSHIYGMPCTGIRFFTVYGPWGRPDMAPMIFTKSILENKPLKIFNNGQMTRDFTYIDDVTEILKRLINKPAKPCEIESFNLNPSKSWAPHRIYNVGNNNPIPLLDFIKELEDELNKSAIKEFQDMQLGDVKSTYADIEAINALVDYKPSTNLKEGLKKFVKWYLDFYNYN